MQRRHMIHPTLTASSVSIPELILHAGLAASVSGNATIHSRQKNIEERHQQIQQSRDSRMEECHDDRDGARRRSRQNQSFCQSNHPRMHRRVNEVRRSRRVGKVSVKQQADQREIHSVKYYGVALLGIPPDKYRREGNQRNREQKREIDPQRFPIRSLHPVKMIVMANPINSQDHKTDRVNHKLVPHSQKFSREFPVDRARGNFRHPHIEDHQRHGDREDAVGQRLDAPLGQPGHRYGFRLRHRRESSRAQSWSSNGDEGASRNPPEMRPQALVRQLSAIASAWIHGGRLIARNSESAYMYGSYISRNSASFFSSGGPVEIFRPA